MYKVGMPLIFVDYIANGMRSRLALVRSNEAHYKCSLVRQLPPYSVELASLQSKWLVFCGLPLYLFAVGLDQQRNQSA
jgi:hypothetical protein